MPYKRNTYHFPQVVAASLSPQPPPPLSLLHSSPSSFSSSTSFKQSLSSSSISIFDIPLITDLILQHLSSKDIGACFRVSKAWNAFSRPYRWRSVSHYFIRHNGYQVHAPSTWWEKGVSRYINNRRNKLNTHSSSSTPFNTSRKKEMIRQHAHWVRSLKLDFSGGGFLDLPFRNLTWLSLNCWYNDCYNWHSKCILCEEKGDSDGQLMEKALDLISRNTRLRDLEISCEILGPDERHSFAVRALRALRSSSSSSSSTTTNTALRSLKLFVLVYGPLTDLCDIVENCPETLQELSLEAHSFLENEEWFFSRPSISELQKVRQRLLLMSPRPALQRLSLQWLRNERTDDGDDLVMDPEMVLCPLLSRFPGLQYLAIPTIAETGASFFFKTIVANCPHTRTINFGDNLILEKDMYLFVETVPGLLGLTMKISADYLDRVLPTLLRHSGSTLQSLRLCEMYSPQDCRSDYIGDFLAYCPLLKALVVVPSYGHSYSSSNISLQDLLHADWTTAASCLETLSISISELVSAPADELDILEESLAILALLDDTQDQGDQELTLHASMVHNVTEFYKRLKALPNLKELDLLWHQSCHLVPYECGIEFSDGLLTMDNLEWMGLDWGTMYGLGTYAAQGDVRRLRILERKSHATKPFSYWVRDPISSCWNNCCCSMDDWDSLLSCFNDDASFEDLHSAYKSRGDRRREQLKRRR